MVLFTAVLCNSDALVYIDTRILSIEQIMSFETWTLEPYKLLMILRSMSLQSILLLSLSLENNFILYVLLEL